MEKRFKNGLVLGKFMPPHAGHLHLINTAAEHCEKVYVMICSIKSEPINGLMRFFWLKEIFIGRDNIEIIHCTDENPQYPHECKSNNEFYLDYWCPSVYSRVEELDVVFTSEEYGEAFATYLAVEHFLVDIKRKTHPVSGTAIRNNPFANWEFIPDVVKDYFTKRIVIMGPESTGKTVLTKNLADHFCVDFVGEYGRTYYEETITPDRKMEREDFYNIAVKHNDLLLDKHVGTTHKCLIVDTEAMTTKIFGEMYVDGYYDNRLDEIIKYQWFDLYLLMDVDVPWVDDGTRDFPNSRVSHFNRLKDELTRNNKPYIVISGNYDERFEKAKRAINEIIG